VGRLDSLVVLDVLLEHCPSLVAGCAVRLLPNLVRLIAQPHQLGTSASSHHGQKSTTSLLVNPNSRLSTQRWRVRVLQRLAAFFDAVVSHSQQQCVGIAPTTSTVVVMVTDTATTHHCIQSSSQITQSSLHHHLLRFLRLHLSLSHFISVCIYYYMKTGRYSVSSILPLTI